MSNTRHARKPLQGRALWTRLVRQQEDEMAEQGGDCKGYVAHHHFRFGKSRATTLAKYAADAMLLDAYKRRLADASTRKICIIHPARGTQA